MKTAENGQARYCDALSTYHLIIPRKVPSEFRATEPVVVVRYFAAFKGKV